MTSPFARARLIAHTARHLRARQVAHRVRHALRSAPAPRAAATPWHALRGTQVLDVLARLGPVDAPHHAEAAADAWCANRAGWLGLDVLWSGDWRMTGPSPLWRYHLHYHDQLADLAWRARRSRDGTHVERLRGDLLGWQHAWAGGGRPAWDAYPVSVRLVNWLRILAWAGDLLDAETRTTLQDGIAVHTAHLRRVLEWHIDGNHLLRNTWALVLGSAVLDDLEALHAARALFERIFAEQVPADGWHEERSPMYHARALRDAIEVATCLRAVGRPLGDAGADRITRMADALPWMQRGDGSLWQLNDTATDHGVDLAPLLTRAGTSESPSSGVRFFGDARAFVLIDPDGDRLRVDLGAPAPPHQPGHAHAGALGFEMDIAGVPFIRDSGCSGYDGDPWRDYLRGTAAHSTIMIDGLSQSELWAVFRMARRAEVNDVTWSGTPADATCSATCRPYHARDITHRRTFTRTGRTVIITDEVTGATGRRVDGFLHFDPAWQAERTGERVITLRHARATVTITVEGPAECSLHHGEQAPRLGWCARGFSDVVPCWTLRLHEASYTDRPWRLVITPG